MLRAPVLHLALGLILGGVFLYASLDKIRDPRSFARIVYHYQLIGPAASIPPWVPNAFAASLPFVEAISGLLLLVRPLRREAAVIAALLLSVFLLAVSSALYRKIDIENCGCFTLEGRGRKAGLGLILEDAALLVGALILASFEPVPPRAGRAA